MIENHRQPNGNLCCLLASAIIALMLLGSNSHAAPMINNISIELPFIRLGEANSVLVNCTDDNGNYTISEVYADINATNISSSNNTFTQLPDGTYTISILTSANSIFWTVGRINVTAHCINNISETAYSTVSFYVINQTFIIERPINITIDSFDDGMVGLFEYPTEITQYSRMNITMEFVNTGSTSYIKKTLMQIGTYDTGYPVISNRTGMTAGIKPGQRILERLRYTPMMYGFYWIRIVVSYGNKTADAWGAFYVKPYYPYIPPSTPSAPAPTTSGGGGGIVGDRTWTIQLPSPTPEEASGPKKEYDVGLKSIKLTYPEKAYLAPGDSAAAYVTVENNGTLTLREMMLLPHIIGGIKVDTQPMILQMLPGNHSAVFMITLDAPINTPAGTYPLDFTLSTDKGKMYGHIDVEVGAATIDDSLGREISNYQYIISKLEDEAGTFDIEGTDISKARLHINEAKDSLKLAKYAYGVKDYETTQNELKRTRKHLTDAVIEMALARKETPLVVMAPTIWLLVALLIIILIAAVTLYLHKRHAEETKEMKEAGEEAAEEGGV